MPMFPLTAFTCTWRAVLNAELRVGVANLSYIFTPVTAAMVLLLAHSRGVIVLAAGSSFGVLAEAVFLACVLCRHRIAPFPRKATLSASFDLPLRAVLVARSRQPRIQGSHCCRPGSGDDGRRRRPVDIQFGYTPCNGRSGGRTRRPWCSHASTILPARGRRVAGACPPGAGSHTAHFFPRYGGPLLHPDLVLGTIARRAFSHGTLTALDLARVAQAQRWSLLRAPFSVGLAILFPFVAALKANHFMLPVLSFALAAHAGLDYLLRANGPA